MVHPHQISGCACAGTDYGFEYSDEDNQEEDVDIENQYYNSKGQSVSGSLPWRAQATPIL
jgi:hypothetical protein